eukprot:NODE_3941_length_834_cov_69.954738_g3918_i0.p1 GENE.NODE_3941_length_834_cov_69.954738_g3918_i0~~NODE_3941_length_834_cov_69.954738_g3918_i0.p1  ORF type:complete len:242 (+),score=61.66 NODE_3941_length_834_cov_69.954738_g3918_i0:49-726(+)
MEAITRNQPPNDYKDSPYLLEGDKGSYLNWPVYLKRIQRAAEVALLEANARGKKDGKKIYLHVVGLGMGVWQYSKKQPKLYGQAFKEALNNCADLSHVVDVDFAWIRGIDETDGFSGLNADGKPWGEIEGATANKHIKLHMSQRAPHEKLPDGKTVMEVFAWDGASYPGNEYWFGLLTASGDPAACAASQISECHNWCINPVVGAHTLHFADPKQGMVPANFPQL